MDLDIIIHSDDNIKSDVKLLIGENLENKISSYLMKFDKKDKRGIIEVFCKENKKGLFDGKLKIDIDGKLFIYEREDYKNVDDLINHLFDHFKEGLSSK